MIRALRRFLADRSGLSAVEFALIAPVLILFYFGVVELDSALSAKRKVTNAASTVADLTAQDRDIDNVEMQAIFTAARAVMAPHDPDDTMQIVVSSVRRDASGDARVLWSEGHNRAGYNRNMRITLPDGILGNAPESLIVAEVLYRYRPPIGEALVRNINMTESFYLRPRRGAPVCRNGGNC